MKTLKRTLCMVLAIVMIVGTLAVSANATSFVDDEEIKYTTAVDVLSGMGVIDGTDGNKFDPKGTLTRAQAAKIIVAIMVGGDTAELANIQATANGGIYSDVKADDWFAGYVEYLTVMGVVGGADGKFMPNNSLSSAAFTKMLLGALGYNAATEGLEGAAWVQKVNNLAKTAGIRDANIKIADSEITREEACQLAYLALTLGECVEYTGATTVVIGGIPVTTGGTRSGLGVNGLEYLMNVKVVEDVIAWNNYCTPAAMHGYTGLKVSGLSFPIETGLDMIGHYVQIYYKDVGAPTDAKPVVAAYDLTSAVVEITASMDATAKFEAFKAAGITVDQANVIEFAPWLYCNDARISVDIDAAAAGYYIVADGAVKAYVPCAPGFNAGIVASFDMTAGSESIVLTNGARIGYPNHDISNIAVGDAIAYFWVTVGAGTIVKVYELDSVSGKLLSYNATTKDVNIGGVKYTASAVTDNTGIVDAAFNFTSDFKLYLFPGTTEYIAIENIDPVDTTVPVKTPVYVVDFYSITIEGATDAFGVTAADTTKYYAQCLNLKGEQLILEVSKATHDAAVVDVLVAATADANGINSFEAISGTYTAKDDLTGAYAAGSLTIADNYYMTSSVKFIYVDGVKSALKVEVIGDNKITDMAASGAIAYAMKADDNGNYLVTTVFVKGTPEQTVASVDPNKQLVWAQSTDASNVKVPYTKADGTIGEAYAITVYIDGAATQVKSLENAIAEQGFYMAEIDPATGLYTFSGKRLAGTTTAGIVGQTFGGDVTNYFNGFLTLNWPTDAAFKNMSTAGVPVTNLSGVADKTIANATKVSVAIDYTGATPVLLAIIIHA